MEFRTGVYHEESVRRLIERLRQVLTVMTAEAGLRRDC